METDTSKEGEPAAPAVSEVVITIVGQVKAGKSSLVNAILGQQKAATDVLPLTNEITRYQLQPKGVSSRLTLLDTVGYGHEGPRRDQLESTRQAMVQSDLVLLVLHARDPARQPDVETLKAIRLWFESEPNLKMPRVLGVLTHIDLLSPVMEWAPPYDYLHPKRPKEKSIHDAAETAQEQFGDMLAGVVPIVPADGKVYGVQEFLLPIMIEMLDEARAVSMLRCLQAEADAGRVKKLFDQLLSAGKELVKAALQGAREGEVRR